MESYPIVFGSSSSKIADSGTSEYKASLGNGFFRSISDDRTEMEFSDGSEIMNRFSSENDGRTEMEFPGGSEIMKRFSSENDDPVKRNGEKKSSRRYAFQTRSQVDVLDDGYRWRKYGQKAVKNNKFPRSYYRCTHQGCKVKKQVQRLTKDKGIVVTTYEGMHLHPIAKSTENFECILNQMQIYTS